MTVSASAYHVAGCLCSPPRFGGEIDYSPLRWCILTGTDCLAYAGQYRVNSRDAEVYLLTNRPYRRPLSTHTISLPTMMDSLCCSQVRRSGQSGTTLRTPPQLISLHVFEDDTVAKVAVSKANLRIFCVGSCWALPLSLLLRCLALRRNANLAGGFAGRFLDVVFVVWLVSHDDLPEIFGPHESCTLLLFTAYAIVRTVPSANRPNRRKKNHCSPLVSSFGR